MKIELLGILFAPVNYLRIKHPDKKWFDVGLPAAISVTATVIYLLLPVPFTLLGQGGLVTQINGLLQVLAGFYIAALAAVATFQGEGMDKLMSGEPPVIKERRNRGNICEVKLSRRRFLSYLFGYLALVCLLVFFSGVLLNLLHPSIMEWGKNLSFFRCVKVAGVFVYTMILANLGTTTMLGLYYLSVRIHRKDSEFTSKDKPEE